MGFEQNIFPMLLASSARYAPALRNEFSTGCATFAPGEEGEGVGGKKKLTRGNPVSAAGILQDFTRMLTDPGEHLAGLQLVEPVLAED